MEQDGAQGCCPPWYTWNQMHFKPQVATYFLVNSFLYHKTIKFGTIVISTGRQQRGEQDWGVFWWAGWKGKGDTVLCTGLVPLLPPALAEPRGLLSLQWGKGKNLQITSGTKVEQRPRRGEHTFLMKSLCWQWLCKWPRMPESGLPPSLPQIILQKRQRLGTVFY